MMGNYFEQLGIDNPLGSLNRSGLADMSATPPMLQGIKPTYKAPPLDTSMWDDTKNLLSNKNFMSGLTGVGQLGLGLAQYMAMKPMYEEQLKGLKQNRQFAAEDQARRNRTATNFDKALQS